MDLHGFEWGRFCACILRSKLVLTQNCIKVNSCVCSLRLRLQEKQAPAKLEVDATLKAVVRAFLIHCSTFPLFYLSTFLSFCLSTSLIFCLSNFLRLYLSPFLLFYFSTLLLFYSCTLLPLLLFYSATFLVFYFSTLLLFNFSTFYF